MASIVFQAGTRILDANGKPVNNAKIYVYDAGTTNESSVYSDKALSSALTQPIRTNSGGLPITSGDAETLIYVASGADYKVEVKTSADAQVWGPIDDYPILGRNSGTVAVNEGGTGSTTAAGARTNLGAAAASDVTSMSSTLSTISGERTALPGGSFGDVAGLDDVTAAYMDQVDEICIQKHYEESTATTSLSTTIPSDNTVPTSSEGTEIFTTSFTPLSSASTLEIVAMVRVQSGVANPAAAIFVGGASAIAVNSIFAKSGDTYNDNIWVTARYAPGSTNAITISVRAGASGGTITLNSTYGAAGFSWFRIRELVEPPIAYS